MGMEAPKGQSICSDNILCWIIQYVLQERLSRSAIFANTVKIITNCVLVQQKPSYKGDLVSADYYGPLVTSTAGVKYILVLTDNITKYVKLYVLKRAPHTQYTYKVKGLH